jgi:hypothetical protein
VRVKFYTSQTAEGGEKRYPQAITSGLREATKIYNDDFEVVHNETFDDVDYDVDVACTFGLMGNVPEIVSAYVNRGKHAIMFDKALFRHLGGGSHSTFRVGIDGPSPVKYIMRTSRNFDRFERRRIQLFPRKEMHGRPKVVYCGSSQKYCDFYKLGDANEYALDVFRQMREVSSKAIFVYRPKPSWQGGRELPDTIYSDRTRGLAAELDRCNLLVTHGSAAAVEAIVAGIPIITLGPCASQFVANRTIDNESILDPYFPSDNARWTWLCNLAYCQWDQDEIRSGEAWGFIRNEIMELGVR